MRQYYSEIGLDRLCKIIEHAKMQNVKVAMKIG